MYKKTFTHSTNIFTQEILLFTKNALHLFFLASKFVVFKSSEFQILKHVKKMENIEVKGFKKVYKTDLELVLQRYWAVRWIYLVPLSFGLYILFASISSGFWALSIILFTIPFIYLGAAGVINNAIFIFDREGFKFKNKPIPWFIPADYAIPRADFKQILRQETRRSSSTDFDVYLELKDGQKILIKSYSNAQDANDLSSVILAFMNKR